MVLLADSGVQPSSKTSIDVQMEEMVTTGSRRRRPGTKE
jgi:hypothetical protein